MKAFAIDCLKMSKIGRGEKEDHGSSGQVEPDNFPSGFLSGFCGG